MAVPKPSPQMAKSERIRWILFFIAIALGAAAYWYRGWVTDRPVPVGGPLTVTTGKVLVIDPVYAGYKTDDSASALLDREGRIARDFAGNGTYRTSRQGSEVTVHAAASQQKSPPQAEFLADTVTVDSGAIAFLDATPAALKLATMSGKRALYAVIDVPAGSYQVAYKELRLGSAKERNIVLSPVK